VTDPTSFRDLGVSQPVVDALAARGITSPFPIQAMVMEDAASGRDTLAKSKTGSGKTLGFALPIVERLDPADEPKPGALVLVPTRELAQQVTDEFSMIVDVKGLRVKAVYGGTNVREQAKGVASADVLIATPGRLDDLRERKLVDLSGVRILVLDEADRMLDMGFIPDVRRILSLLTNRQQSLLFSATLTSEIRKLADSFLRDPVVVQVAPKLATADLVTHIAHPVPREKKRELLVHIIKSRGMKQVLVFVATRIGCNRLAYQLNREGVHATAIHGDRTQAERQQALDDFKAGKVAILVATDVAARGLDIDHLPFVVNFELPNSPEDYVHRIGRTGRAGAAGTAVSLVCGEETERLAEIEKTIRLRIPRETVPGFGPHGTEAPLMEPPRKDGRRSPDGDRLTGHRRREPAARPAAPAADPIFSRPYEPGMATAAKPAPPSGPQKRSPQVAALLGGFKKAS
jgi:ATP-dependent RNA helicase RhlE